MYELTPHTIKTNKHNTFVPFTNDLNIINKLLGNTFPSEFLKGNVAQRKRTTVTKLKRNLFVEESSLDKSLLDLLPTMSKKSNIKIPNAVFSTLFSLPKFDNAPFGEITKAISISTLQISLLGLEYLYTHGKTWVLNFNNEGYPFETNTLKSITLLSKRLGTQLNIVSNFDVSLTNSQDTLLALHEVLPDSTTVSLEEVTTSLVDSAPKNTLEKAPPADGDSVLSGNDSSKENPES